MKKVFYFTLTMLVAIIFTLSLMSCKKCKPRHISFEKRANFFVKILIKKLALTPEQQAIANKIKDEIIAKRKENKDIRKKIREEFNTRIKSTNIDKDKLIKFLESFDEKRKEMRNFMLDKLIEFHKVLTPDQRTKFVDLRNKFFKKRCRK